MNKGVVIGLVVFVALVVGILFWSSSATVPTQPGAATPPAQTSASSGATVPSASDAVLSGKADITIKDYHFSPNSIKVKKGTTVFWTNQDSAKHTVTSDVGSALDSGLIAPDGSFAHTLNEVGTYPYHCSPHPYMKATIEVVE